MTDVTTVIPSVGATCAVGEFRIGRVFSRTLTLLSRNFPIYFAVAAFPALPGVLLDSGSADTGTAAVLSLLGFLGIAVLNPLGQAIILHTAFQDMGGYRVSLSQSVRAALGRWLPLIGLIICTGLAIGVGFLLLIVPGFILMAMWYVAMPACVVERLGVSASMARSSALTKGYRWQIFGMAALIAVASGMVAGVVKGVLGLTGSGGIVMAGSLASSALAGAFGAIFIVVAYYDLRVAKEGIDIRQIAAVFE
jgi:hypothetical protein